MSQLNIVIATHGRFGEELVKSAEMIAGGMEQVKNLSLLPEMSFEDFMHHADELIAGLEGPVLVLVDLYGGTPCNVLTVLSRKYHYDVVTGVNLPMLIDLCMKTMTMDEVDTAELARGCIETLQESGVHTNRELENQGK